MELIRNKKLVKVISIFFLLTFLNAVVFPSVSYALTAGPTAPEFSSFEPVDTTDMVNLATGDLTYNIPLLEVPGPEGGYPMALSYHAGIQPDEEASWVGLGWSLNPGAINRTVNGYPDDFKGISSSVYDYWKGGKSEAFSVGVSAGLGYAGANFGLTFSQDTYQGFGVGWDAGIGVSSGFAGGAVTIGIGTSVGPYGGSSTYAGLNIGATQMQSANLGAGIGIVSNSEGNSVNGHIGLSNGSTSLLGASIGSNSMKPSLSIAGVSISQINSNAGRISSKSFGIGIAIPIPETPLWISLGYRYVRYWSAETSFVNKYGSLYYPQNIDAEHQSFDTYTVLDSDNPTDYNQEADKQYGGSLPAYDQYMVTGQGVGGSIQPYILDNINLFKQNRKRIEKDKFDATIYHDVVTYHNTGYVNQKKVNFRFNNDFSNAYLRNAVVKPSGGDIASLLNNFDSQVNVNSEGFESSDNHLAGSRHIEWFTNNDIIAPSVNKMGLIIPEGSYSNRTQNFKSYNISEQVGAFMVTNETGVTYHYAQPVYTYEEFSNWTSFDGATYRNNSNPQPYAYTWLLTAITGPDYVDRGLAGLDQDDWGYWVKFDYGKWSDAYQWRNPSIGFHKDLEQETNFYSKGKKELYYLDAIITRTHTALFEKEMRKDGKGVSGNANGGFAPQETVMLSCPSPIPNSPPNPHCTIIGDSKYYSFPVSSLKLSNIYLFNNEELQKVMAETYGVNDLVQFKAKSQVSTTFNYSGNIIGGTNQSITVTVPHYFNNVFEKDDLLSGINTFKSNALRVIVLNNSDYSLSPGTDNSFSNDEVYQKYPPASLTKNGKLTLTGIDFRGKGSAKVIPPMTFEYKNPSTPYLKDKYDIWGMYKSDYVPGATNENLLREVTSQSASNVDTWSLERIKTSLGSDIVIKYESDEYANAVFPLPGLSRLKNVTPSSFFNQSVLKVEIHDEDLINLNSMAFASVNLDFVAAYNEDDFNIPSFGDLNNYGCPTYPTTDPLYRETKDKTIELRSYRGTGNVVEVNIPGKYIKIQPSFNSIMNNDFKAWDNITMQREYCTNHCGTDLVSKEWSSCTALFSGSAPNYIVGGIVNYNLSNSSKKGGGLRVQSISVASSDNKKIYSTNYSYGGGTTSYIPVKALPSILYPFITLAKQGEKNQAKQMVSSAIYRHIYAYMSKVNEIPAPGVIYSSVTVRESANLNGQNHSAPGYKTYNFSTFNLSGSKPDYSRTAPVVYDAAGLKTRKITLQDYSNRVGNLINVYTIDTKNNKTIDQISNTYLHNVVASNSQYASSLTQKYFDQGRIDQVFHEYRVLDEQEPGEQGQLILTRKEQYPLILVKQEKKNFRTGITEVSENLAFDYYSGQATQVLSSDAYGNQFKTVSEAAYHKYPSMGLRVKSPANKNMLAQNTLTHTYKIDNATDQNPIGLVASAIQTWSNQVAVNGVGIQSDIWRQQAAWTWTGDNNTSLLEDGTHPYAAYSTDAFNWNTGQPNSVNTSWQKNGEVTLYDAFSHGLEAKDINNNFAATLMDVDSKKVIALVTNAGYSEIAFSGAEYYKSGVSIEGRVNQMEGIPNSEQAHSGKRSLQVNPGKEGFQITLSAPSRKYHASVWVYFAGESQGDLNDAQLYYKTGNTIVDFKVPVEARKSKNWYLLNLDIPQGGNSIVIGCKNNSSLRSIYFDDFRVHPLDASMSSYVYDPSAGELTHILDSDNLYTKFEYDEMGRLKRTYKEFFYTADKKVNEQNYNYLKPLADW